ncbi:RNA polymerase sigma factor [Labilithrix luteola]|uniref:RNA polymerase sigma factor n=1 Tax=Labilithrix luteola TaxID=1391654 RepID=UPI0014736B63|nr:RNA polymerase sigma factor [Labilithrix luteola]
MSAAAETPRGGVPAFAELYREHFAWVWGTARRLGVDHGEVDDVVQETFLTLHRHLETSEPPESMRGWLFSVLFRVVQRHRRSSRRRKALAEEGSNVAAMNEASARAPDVSVENGERIRLLEEILDNLDEDRRAVIVLAEIEEKSSSEIAEILGINVNTVMSRLRLAREYVTASLARHRARDGWRFR